MKMDEDGKTTKWFIFIGGVYIYIYTYTHTHIYIYIHIYMCVCVVVETINPYLWFMTLQVPESPAHLCRSPRSVPSLENEAFLKNKKTAKLWRNMWNNNEYYRYYRYYRYNDNI